MSVKYMLSSITLLLLCQTCLGMRVSDKKLVELVKDANTASLSQSKLGCARMYCKTAADCKAKPSLCGNCRTCEGVHPKGPTGKTRTPSAKPMRGVRSSRTHAEPSTASQEGNTDNCFAEAYMWCEGDELARGAYGRVSKVRRGNGKYGAYVMKEALDKKSRVELAKEVDIMSQIDCPGVLKVVNPAPVDSAGRKIPGAFVMPQMKGTLWDWVDGVIQTRGQRAVDDCKDDIATSLASALGCIHAAQYTHSDFKGDQVLYKTLDGRGCPQDLVIADFGLSQRIGDVVYKMNPKNYTVAGHMPGELFRGTEDRFPATLLGPQSQNDDDYDNSAIIDWCSFSYEMLTLSPDMRFMESLRIPRQYTGQACGWMGPARSAYIVLGEAPSY